MDVTVSNRPERHRRTASGPSMMSASWCLALVVFLVDGPASAQLALDKTTGELARGQRLFEAHCARCHGMKGGGGTGANLSRPVLRYADDDQGVFSVVQDGIPGTEMPGNWFLTDREIRQV